MKRDTSCTSKTLAFSLTLILGVIISQLAQFQTDSKQIPESFSFKPVKTYNPAEYDWENSNEKRCSNFSLSFVEEARLGVQREILKLELKSLIKENNQKEINRLKAKLRKIEKLIENFSKDANGVKSISKESKPIQNLRYVEDCIEY